MGMWEGLYVGMQGIRERRDREMDREEARRVREEDMAFRREQFEFQQADARRRMIADLYPNLLKQSAAQSELNGQRSILSGYFSDQPELVDKIINTGNTEAISRVIQNLEKNFEAASLDGQGEQYLQTWATTVMNSSRFTEATPGEIDFSMFEGVVSPEDLTSLGLSTTFTRPGTIEVAPVIYQPAATPEDLNVVERRIASTAVEQGNREMQRLDRASAQITAMLDDSSLDPDRQTALRADLVAVGDRRRMVEGALDDTKGDRPSFSGILSIFGNSATDRVLSSSTRRVDPNSLTPAFTEISSGQPITVTSPDQAQRFFDLGIITENDTIMYNGQQFLVRDLFEG
jgi:dsDNA-binding SOS-regulon protein